MCRRFARGGIVECMQFGSRDPERPNCLPISSGNQSGSRRDCVYLVLMYAAVIFQHWFGTKRAKLRRCFAGFGFMYSCLFYLDSGKKTRATFHSGDGDTAMVQYP